MFSVFFEKRIRSAAVKLVSGVGEALNFDVSSNLSLGGLVKYYKFVQMKRRQKNCLVGKNRLAVILLTHFIIGITGDL